MSIKDIEQASTQLQPSAVVNFRNGARTFKGKCGTNSMINYRSLDPAKDWCFFVEDYAVPTELLQQIHPLTEESARNLWHQFISPCPNSGHPMLLPNASWPSQLFFSTDSAFWQGDWHDEVSTTFQDWLTKVLSWSSATSLIFSWSACDAVQTSKSIFCSYWRNFLFKDEGPFVWSLQQPQSIRFMPNGFAYAGLRHPFQL